MLWFQFTIFIERNILEMLLCIQIFKCKHVFGCHKRKLIINIINSILSLLSLFLSKTSYKWHEFYTNLINWKLTVSSQTRIRYFKLYSYNLQYATVSSIIRYLYQKNWPNCFLLVCPAHEFRQYCANPNLLYVQLLCLFIGFRYCT